MSQLIAKLFPSHAAKSAISDLEREIWLTDIEHASSRIEELRARIASIPASDMRAAIERSSQQKTPSIPVIDGVAHIAIRGDLFASVPWIYDAFGIEATGYLDVRRALHAAVADEKVKSIVLNIDSPGGTVTGLGALADDVAKLRETKPIHAHASGTAASAAYWIGSQASVFTAEATSQIGSIGVLQLVQDSSRRADMQGVKVHAVRSGPDKAVGAPGVPVSHDQLKSIQENVDETAKVFKAAVARGRGVDLARVETWATGRTWSASQAQQLGLIDVVSSLEEAHAAAVVAAGTNLAREGGDTQDARSADVFGQEAQVQEKEISALAERMAALEKKSEVEAKEKSEAQARVAELEQELKQTKAAAAAQATALAEVTKARKAQAIEAGVKAGRVVPGMRASVEIFADTCGEDVAKLEGFIASLPVQINAVAAGNSEAQGGDEAKMSKDDLAVARALGLSPEQMAKADSVVSISMDRTVLRGDGTRVALKEVV